MGVCGGMVQDSSGYGYGVQRLFIQAPASLYDTRSKVDETGNCVQDAIFRGLQGSPCGGHITRGLRRRGRVGSLDLGSGRNGSSIVACGKKQHQHYYGTLRIGYFIFIPYISSLDSIVRFP
jgi:hypothetical protein